MSNYYSTYAQNLEAELFALAATQCAHPSGDERGNFTCKYQLDIQKLSERYQGASQRIAELKAENQALKAMLSNLIDAEFFNADDVEERELMNKIKEML